MLKVKGIKGDYDERIRLLVVQVLWSDSFPGQ